MKTVYACGVDWQHEIGEASDLEGSMPFYSSVEALKKEKPCSKQCGIVELKLSLSRWVEPQDLFLDLKQIQAEELPVCQSCRGPITGNEYVHFCSTDCKDYWYEQERPMPKKDLITP